MKKTMVAKDNLNKMYNIICVALLTIENAFIFCDYTKTVIFTNSVLISGAAAIYASFHLEDSTYV